MKLEQLKDFSKKGEDLLTEDYKHDQNYSLKLTGKAANKTYILDAKQKKPNASGEVCFTFDQTFRLQGSDYLIEAKNKSLGEQSLKLELNTDVHYK